MSKMKHPGWFAVGVSIILMVLAVAALWLIGEKP